MERALTLHVDGGGVEASGQSPPSQLHKANVTRQTVRTTVDVEQSGDSSQPRHACSHVVQVLVTVEPLT